MPRSMLNTIIEGNGRVYDNASHCRETLLFARNEQEEEIGSFSGIAGEMSLNLYNLDVVQLEEAGVNLVRKYHPKFTYHVTAHSVVIPEQGFTALEGHAILGALRDGPGEREDFFLYLVQALQGRKYADRSRSRENYNGPATWASDHFDMKTLWEVCREYRKIEDLPEDDVAFSNHPVVRTQFKTYFLPPESLVAGLKGVTACTKCGEKDCFRVFFFRASGLHDVEVEEPWLETEYSTTYKHRAKRPLLNHIPFTVSRYSGPRIGVLAYASHVVYALGLMFIKGEK